MGDLKMDGKWLIDNGFTKHKPDKWDSPYIEANYQKCYRDDKHNKKYFLNVHEYAPLPHVGTKEKTYEISTQLYLKGTHNAVNLLFLNDDIDAAINTIELMFSAGIIENYES